MTTIPPFVFGIFGLFAICAVLLVVRVIWHICTFKTGYVHKQGYNLSKKGAPSHAEFNYFFPLNMGESESAPAYYGLAKQLRRPYNQEHMEAIEAAVSAEQNRAPVKARKAEVL